MIRAIRQPETAGTKQPDMGGRGEGGRQATLPGSAHAAERVETTTRRQARQAHASGTTCTCTWALACSLTLQGSPFEVPLSHTACHTLSVVILA